jgi:biotin synthase
MTGEEILACVEKAHSLGCDTVVLQSGEDNSMARDWLAELIGAIKKDYALAITLCVGERPLGDYQLWRENGADRYLLKFETSDSRLFRKIHRPRRKGEPRRTELLKALQDLGYETGSGIMVGLPGQTYESLADDIELFAKLKLDMIGIGPYVPHPQTPLGRQFQSSKNPIHRQIPNSTTMTHKVMALSRVVCPKAHLPSTTSLATLNPDGLQSGLEVGANVVMPNVTPRHYRKHYEIYPNSSRSSLDHQYDRLLRSNGAARKR